MSEELVAQLDKVVKRNIGLEEELMKLKVSPQPAVLYTIRLNMLLDKIFEGDEDTRLAFEIEYQGHINALLMRIHQQVLEERSQAKILIPSQSVSSSIGSL